MTDEMVVTYGLERECAFFDEHGKYSSDHVTCSIVAKNRKPVGGFSIYSDCGHVEIASPPKAHLLGAVSMAREIDALQSKFCESFGCAARKGNICYANNVTFANHDNYVFYNREFLKAARELLMSGPFRYGYGTRSLICGEGGFYKQNFVISPRTIYRGWDPGWKGLRLHSHASMDNCSPVSTAIRIGSVPIMLGLAMLGRLPDHRDMAAAVGKPSQLHGPLPELGGLEMCRVSGGKLSDIAIAGLHYQLAIADAALNCAGDDFMIPETALIAGWWKRAATEILDGKFPMWLDWTAKYSFFQKTGLCGVEALAADLNWHRLDWSGETIYGAIERSYGPDIMELAVPYSLDRHGLCGLSALKRIFIDETSPSSFSPCFITENRTINVNGLQNSGLTVSNRWNDNRLSGNKQCIVIPEDDGQPVMSGVIKATPAVVELLHNDALAGRTVPVVINGVETQCRACKLVW